MMDDLISRQAAIEMFHRVANIGWNHGIETTVADAFKEAAEMVENLPTAEPRIVTMKLKVDAEDMKKAMQDAEVTLLPAEKKGKWEEYCGDLICDQCRNVVEIYGNKGKWNYCPNCGARMEES